MIELSDDEIKAIEIWTNGEFEYRKIKAVINNTYNDEYDIEKFDEYNNFANLLLGLFDKIEDKTNGLPIYRGDIIENDAEDNKSVYEKYLLENKINNVISIGNSILSCSLSKNVAINAPSASDEYWDELTPTILYVLNKRKSKFINISKHSQVNNEFEVLCGINKKFRVIDIKEYPNINHLEYSLDEV